MNKFEISAVVLQYYRCGCNEGQSCKICTNEGKKCIVVDTFEDLIDMSFTEEVTVKIGKGDYSTEVDLPKGALGNWKIKKIKKKRQRN